MQKAGGNISTYSAYSAGLIILILGQGDPSWKVLLACRIPLRQSSCSLRQSVRSRWVRLSLRFSLCPCCKLRLGPWCKLRLGPCCKLRLDPCCKLRLGPWCKLRLARLRSDWWRLIGSLVDPRPRFKPENEEQPTIACGLGVYKINIIFIFLFLSSSSR